MKDKLDIINSIKVLISPWEKGFTCGLILGENNKMTSEQYELISTVARGMIKFASDTPDEAFKLGMEGFCEDKEKDEIPNDVHCLSQSDIDPYNSNRIIDFLKIRDLKRKSEKK
tara:strand:- start:1784 stop:2125 length:342 start_codon:yes stop_codon:yes gene_type:complete